MVGLLFPVIRSLEDGSDLWGPKKLGSRTHLPPQRSKADGSCSLEAGLWHLLLLIANQKGKGTWVWSGLWQRAPCKVLARDAAVRGTEGCSVLEQAAA